MSDATNELDPATLATIRARGGQWACYQCQALDSESRGHIALLRYGEGCTYPAPPAKYPGDSLAVSWSYVHIGDVDLKSGEIQKKSPADSASST